jgi:hypothetical protein
LSAGRAQLGHLPGVYRTPAPPHDDDRALMRRTELFTAWPFRGSRWMTAMLRAERYAINRKPTAATAIAAMGSLISSGDRNGRESD